MGYAKKHGAWADRRPWTERVRRKGAAGIRGREREMTVWTSPPGAAARLVPEIGDVIVYGAPWLRARPPPHQQRGRFRQGHLAAGGVGHLMSQNLKLEESAALIARAPLAISDNIGPAHVLCPAAGVTARCAGKDPLCLRGVQPEAVVAAALELLAPVPLECVL